MGCRSGPFCWNISLFSEAVANNHSRTASNPCLHLDKNFGTPSERAINQGIVPKLCVPTDTLLWEDSFREREKPISFSLPVLFVVMLKSPASWVNHFRTNVSIRSSFGFGARQTRRRFGSQSVEIVINRDIEIPFFIGL
ncbi:hypothetical protein V6Z11_D02G279400 [Gossypium hirsutum]